MRRTLKFVHIEPPLSDWKSVSKMRTLTSVLTASFVKYWKPLIPSCALTSLRKIRWFAQGSTSMGRLVFENMMMSDVISYQTKQTGTGNPIAVDEPGYCVDTEQRLEDAMGDPVERPQREVIFRQGPWAGTVGLVEDGCIEVSFINDAGEPVVYKQDQQYKEYFVFVESANHD